MSPHRHQTHKARRIKKPMVIGGILVAVAAIAIVAYIVMNPTGSSNPTASKNKVLLFTSMGNITIQLRNDTPITTANFKQLVQEGKYDGTLFDRVSAGVMIQGGQILSAWHTIPDEIGSNNHNTLGTVAMAKTAQPNSASTQFFINVADNSHHTSTFDATYTVFGDVISGMDVADAISRVPVMADSTTADQFKPVQDVVLIKAELID